MFVYQHTSIPSINTHNNTNAHTYLNVILVGVNDYGKGSGYDQINRMNNAET